MQIEMSPDEAKDFAAWLRERANRYLQRADTIEHRQGDSATNGRMRAQPPATPEPSRNANLTLEEFERSATNKSGRVYDLARRLNVEESVILGFLAEPNVKVAIGKRGWIKPKDKIDKET